METRIRKRAEASNSAALSGLTTRATKRTSARSIAMKPNSEPSTASGSTTHSRRSRNPSANHNCDNNNNNRDNANPDKGKGEDSEDTHRETERSSGLNIDSHDGVDEDNDSDSELGLGAYGSRSLVGLFRKLSSGLFDLHPISAIKKILPELMADGEEGRQVEALMQLCDVLSMATVQSLRTFPVDTFIPVLVGLLNHESNPDIMLFAARSLTHLADVLTSSCAAVVHYGAVSSFTARLINIEYMDLAEQSLQALNKISKEHPTACLRAGALMAVLSYLDFFSTGVQRVALSTAENMCKKLPSDAADFVMESVSLLTNLLQCHDAKVLESASICLTLIVEAFASSPEKLDELCNRGVVAQVSSLISSSLSGGGQASLGTSTYTGLIRLLSTCASGSTIGSMSLLLHGISGILRDILASSGSALSMSDSPPEQIFEIVNLANELLPPLPQGTISLPVSSSFFMKGPLPNKGHTDSSSKPEDSNGMMQPVSTREKLLNDQPELLQHFGMDILPVLVQIYGSSVSGPVRHKCLSVIGKLMYFSSAESIQSLNNVTNISSFLAGLLAWEDPQVLVPALQITETLMEKLPGTFSKMFVKEGVVHAVDMLILTGSASSSLPSSKDKDYDSISRLSSRSRGNRRRGSNSTCYADSIDDSKYTVPDVVTHPNLAEIPDTNSILRAAVSACAKSLKDKYFHSDPEASDDIIRLKNLGMKLNLLINNHKTKLKGKSKASRLRPSDISANNEEILVEGITDMLQELSRDDGVSTFEFVGSGVIATLLNYFTCGYFSKERLSEVKLLKLREQAIKRYISFVSIALPSSVAVGSAVPMRILVHKLQNALSSLEQFPVVQTHASRSSGGNGCRSSGLDLSRKFKLRLCRAQGEKSLCDYSSNVVLVDPLESLASVEDFLWPMVQQNESGQIPLVSTRNSGSGTMPMGPGVSSPSASSATRIHSTRARSFHIGHTNKKDSSVEKSVSSSNPKGKALLKPDPDEGKVPQTRNAARRRPALDKENEMKFVDGDSSSEDDKLDISPVEIDERLVIEDDGISDDDDEEEDISDDDDEDDDYTFAFLTSNNVHEIELDDSTEDSPVPPPCNGQNNPLQSGSSYGSRGAMSFAAAGLASVSSLCLIGGRDMRARPLVGSKDSPRLIFTVGGRQLQRHLTIYQAVQQYRVMEDEDDQLAGSDIVSIRRSRLCTNTYTITYHRADGQAERASLEAVSSVTPSKSANGSLSNSGSDPSSHHVSLLDSILQGELPCDLERSNSTYCILALLRVLQGLNQVAPCLRVQQVMEEFSEGETSILNELNCSGVKVHPDDFINNKLTAKLARQIQDGLALVNGSLPSWCYQLTKACPFLFPFETRCQYFYSTAFGLSRALYRLQQHGADYVKVGRLERQKVRVSRTRILESAGKVMDMYSSQKDVLEVEYFGEVGTGLGPTLEFYTLLSRELQKSGLGMWRLAGGDKDIVHVPLFPRPWPQNADTSDGSQFSMAAEYYRLLGQLTAKALQDGRLLDLPLSDAFYKLVLGQELNLHDIVSFDLELGNTLQELQGIVLQKKYRESTGSYNPEELRFRGASIEDLCLDFSLPGYPEYVLRPDSDTVDLSSLEDYISLVTDATIGTGIMRQMEAFTSGFNQVFDITTLQIFSPNELDYLLCGRRELWKAESLTDDIKFDHGYNSKSPVIINLVEIMGEFTMEQQLAFCQFVTGAPRLPPGGLAALNPKLTVVRKHSSRSTNATKNNGSGSAPSESADEDLPSVMTCVNYLKLPPYSSKEIILKKLLYAINEGQGSFDLS